MWTEDLQGIVRLVLLAALVRVAWGMAGGNPGSAKPWRNPGAANLWPAVEARGSPPGDLVEEFASLPLPLQRGLLKQARGMRAAYSQDVSNYSTVSPP